MRLVCFNAKQRRRIVTFFFDDGKPVNFRDCEIKMSRQGTNFEVLLKTSTEINESEKNIQTPGDEIGQVNSMSTMSTFERINIKVKVISVNDPVVLANNKTKQDVIVADKSSSTHITLWEEQINTLKYDSSYFLKNLMVREFSNQKYLSMPKDDSKIIKIDDI